MAPCEQFMGGRKGQLLKVVHGESARQCLQLSTSVAGDKEFSSQRTPRDETLSKNFLLTLFLGHDSHNRQLWDSLGNDPQHDDCVQQTPHHLQGVGQAHPTRSHLTSLSFGKPP